MNAEKFTQKSLEAIQKSQNLAVDYSNQQIEPEHIFYALIDEKEDLISQLLVKMGIPYDDSTV